MNILVLSTLLMLSFSALGSPCGPVIIELLRNLEQTAQLGAEENLFNQEIIDKFYPTKCHAIGNSHYRVHLKDDNRSVVVEVQRFKNGEPRLYGPFLSAYKK